MYSSEEEASKRLKIFCENLGEIVEINKKQKSWRARVNEYSDLSWNEFKEAFTMKNTSELQLHGVRFSANFTFHETGCCARNNRLAQYDLW